MTDAIYFAPEGTPPPTRLDIEPANPWTRQWSQSFAASPLAQPIRINYPGREVMDQTTQDRLERIRAEHRARMVPVGIEDTFTWLLDLVDKQAKQIAAVQAVTAAIEADDRTEQFNTGQHLYGAVIMVAEYVNAALDNGAAS